MGLSVWGLGLRVNRKERLARRTSSRVFRVNGDGASGERMSRFVTPSWSFDSYMNVASDSHYQSTLAVYVYVVPW